MKWFILVFTLVLIIVGFIFWELYDIIKSFQTKLECERRHRREDLADLRIRLNALRSYVMDGKVPPINEMVPKEKDSPFESVPKKSDVAIQQYGSMLDTYMGENPLIGNSSDREEQ